MLVSDPRSAEPAHRAETSRQTLVASNRGPVAFVVGEDGELVAKRGAGGLVTALTAAVETTDGLWLASAMTEGDRIRAAESPDGRVEATLDEQKVSVRFEPVDRRTYDAYYNKISNRLMWFLHHYLWNLSREPVLDASTRRAWDAYRRVNESFAESLSEETHRKPSNVLVQDYHLSVVPAALRARDPAARILYFHHIPFASPDHIRLLPEWLRGDLLAGLLGADVIGFQGVRWADNFLAACRLLPGAAVNTQRRLVRFQGRTAHVRTYPVAVDAQALREQSITPRVENRIRALDRALGDRKLLLRVDRAELSKNILRGFLAYEDLLRRHRRWRRRVMFLALLNPSRRGLAEYRAYTDECLQAAERINRELGTEDWRPIEVRMSDDFDRVLAAYRRYDVLLTNPILDGMNLVANEGPLLNDRHGILVLSRGAGAFERLGRAAVPVDPLDVAGTAEALREALEMPEEERTRRAAALARAAGATSPADWVDGQIRDLEELVPGP